jgi:hypothetical protein
VCGVRDPTLPLLKRTRLPDLEQNTLLFYLMPQIVQQRENEKLIMYRKGCS